MQSSISKHEIIDKLGDVIIVNFSRRKYHITIGILGKYK